MSNRIRIVWTYRVVENGIETVTITENGVLKSKTVNGVQQSIKGPSDHKHDPKRDHKNDHKYDHHLNKY